MGNSRSTGSDARPFQDKTPPPVTLGLNTPVDIDAGNNNNNRCVRIGCCCVGTGFRRRNRQRRQNPFDEKPTSGLNETNRIVTDRTLISLGRRPKIG